jgi:hypothetical protein
VLPVSPGEILTVPVAASRPAANTAVVLLAIIIADSFPQACPVQWAGFNPRFPDSANDTSRVAECRVPVSLNEMGKSTNG